MDPLAPKPDRLAELRRQRALVAAHLTWLDGEIAAAEAQSGGPAMPAAIAAASQATTGALPPASTAANPVADPLTDQILREYRTEAESSPTKMRRGCLWLFGVALAALILGVAAVWWFGYHR